MILTKNSSLFFLILVQLFLVKILSNNFVFINNYFPYLFSKLNFFQRKFFSIFPLDVGNCLYFVVGLLILLALIKSIKTKKFFQTLLITLNCIIFSFYLTWGFNYYNTETESRYLTNNISDKKLIQFSEFLYKKTIFYSKLSDRDQSNSYLIQNKNKLYLDILEAQSKTKILSNKTIHKTVNTKPSIFGELFSYIGIGGVYNPFTAEAVYNNTMPSIKLPFTISHEMAHQLGFASESEANFIGFLVGTNSSDNSIKYAIYYTALKYAMFCLFERAPDLYPFYLSRFNDRMTKDFEQEKAYFNKYSSEAEVYFSYSNDLFLKLNNQQEGINSYNKFIYILINYYNF